MKPVIRVLMTGFSLLFRSLHRSIRIPIVSLDLRDHVHAIRMAPAEFFRVKKAIHNHLSKLVSYDALPHRDDLAVIVFLDHFGCIAI